MGNIISRNSAASKAELEELGQRLAASDAAVLRKEKDLVEREKELEVRNTERSKLSEQVGSLQDKIAELGRDRNEQLEELQSQLEQKRSDGVEAQDEALETMREEQERLKSELKELEERLMVSSQNAEELAADRDATEKELKEAMEQRQWLVQSLTEALMMARRQLDEAVEIHNTLKNEIVSTKFTSFEMIEKSRTELEDLQVKHSALEKEHQKVQKDSEEKLAAAEKEALEWKERYTTLQLEMDDRLIELVEARARCESLQKGFENDDVNRKSKILDTEIVRVDSKELQRTDSEMLAFDFDFSPTSATHIVQQEA